MAVYKIEPERASLIGKFSRELKPILTIRSGDTVCFRTLDAGWGLEPLRSDGTQRNRFEPRDPERDAGHAMCGPIAIDGAEPEMTLEVRIDTLRPGVWGWNSAGGWPSRVNTPLGVSDGPEVVNRWVLDTENMTGINQNGYEVRLQPFLG